MQSIKQIIHDRFQQAFQKVLSTEHHQCSPLLSPTQNPEFGDWQANFAMKLGKKLGKNPRQVAQQILDQIHLSDIATNVTIAGPGFINITLSPEIIERQLQQLTRDHRLGIPQTTHPQTIVVDYGGPNVAKEMHVGHLRSGVIGDAIVRLLEFSGHTMIRQNHLGDWGTQFGMLVEYILANGYIDKLDSLSTINRYYQAAKKQFDEDEGFAIRARARVVALQRGDAETREIWQTLVTQSVTHFQTLYNRLGISLRESDNCPESFYNDKLASLVAELNNTGHLVDSEGAKVIFLDGFVDKDDNPLPLIVVKSDGGYLYATTDLACLRYRVNELKASRIIYVTDHRQKQHFAMLFSTVQKLGWVSEDFPLQHVGFGSILNKERKPFKTRSGEVIRLSALLDEAQARAQAVISEKRGELSEEEKTQIAKIVAISALKYADLASDKIKDYVFDWDQMLSFEGNTAPYLLNAYVRIQAIFRKGNIDVNKLLGFSKHTFEPEERVLACQLLNFSELIAGVSTSLAIHRLCQGLYEIAAQFHRFYEHCPILSADNEQTRNNRLVLCQLTARTLTLGLSLLGISTLDRM